MGLCWKVLIPSGRPWILVTGAIVTLPPIYSTARAALIIVASVLLVILVLGPLFVGPPRGVAPKDKR